VGGTDAEPIYIMSIEGYATEGIPALESALDIVRAEGIDASLQAIETLVG